MTEQDYMAIGRETCLLREIEKAHEKRREWAHNIEKLTSQLREPFGYHRKDAAELDIKAFDSACEELKRFSREIVDHQKELKIVQKELNQ